ncbi:HEPN domain-containing protein [Chitinophaga sp.]|uniref:HEPN domain-containing protein n=1 Tax=Chitinophaga sp. TaxID=1869181 RepID=UPI002604810E|nr:HEPN domain-containing protein [uncultured Chitinophaga sp.]
MRTAFNQFLVNIEEIRKTHLASVALAASLGGTKIIDFDNVKRSCIVLGVSALDHYIHEITVIGMIEIFRGIRAPTKKYLKHNVSLELVGNLSHSSPHAIFEAEIRKNLGWQSYQKPDKVKDAIALFSSTNLWQQVSLLMHDTEVNIKTQLSLIVDRRNMIAHEADIEPVYKTRRPISDAVVTTSIDFIENVGTAISKII